MNIKQLTKRVLQTTFGLKRYIYGFSIYKIHTLYRDVNKKIMFAFPDLVPIDSLILDIGANSSFVTYHLAKKQGCPFIAFEPILINYTSPGYVAHILVKNRLTPLLNTLTKSITSVWWSERKPSGPF